MYILPRVTRYQFSIRFINFQIKSPSFQCTFYLQMENCVQKIKWLIGDTSIYPVSSLSHEQRSYDSSKLPSGRNTCVSDIQVVFKLFKLRSVFTFIKTKIFKCVFYNTNSTNYIHLNSLLLKKNLLSVSYPTYCLLSVQFDLLVIIL